MGKIKDQLNKKNDTVTLTEAEIEYLKAINVGVRQDYDRMQQNIAATFLKFIAVNRFDYNPDLELSFNLDLEKTNGNLEIVKLDK